MDNNSKNTINGLNLCRPSELKSLLERHGFSFTKSLGQNFLTDDAVLNKITAASNLNEASCVLEIGPGAGTLTQRLALTGARCTAVEIDKALLPVLSETMSGFENFNLINQDIMKTDLTDLVNTEFNGRPFHVIANLPYYITTPIIMMILESGLPVLSMTLMVQKEVADRMCADCGGKDYGALSVAVQYYADASVICKAEPHCFIPQPKVASSVVHLEIPSENGLKAKDEKKFFNIVKSAFGQRRKTLVNALSKSPYFSADKQTIINALTQMNLNPNIRGEKLSIKDFIRLSELI